MKLGCLDFNFNYLPFPAAAAKLGTYSFMALARLGVVKRYRYINRALGKISQMGFDGVQVMCEDVRQMPLKPEQLSILCSELNLPITALGGYTNFFDSGRMDRFRKVIDYAAEAGTKIVCTHSGKGADTKAMMENTASAVDYASSRGIIIALENSPLHSVSTPDDVLAVLKEIPGLRINLDPANFYLSGADPVDAARALKKRVAHVHAKDAAKPFRFVPLGRGEVPWHGIIRALRNYAGFIVIEHESGGNPLACTKESKHYLEKELKSYDFSVKIL